MRLLNLPIELALLSSFTAGWAPQLAAACGRVVHWFCGCLGPGYWHIPRGQTAELLGCFLHESRRYVCRFCTSHLVRVKKELLYRLQLNCLGGHLPRWGTLERWPPILTGPARGCQLKGLAACNSRHLPQTEDCVGVICPFVLIFPIARQQANPLWHVKIVTFEKRIGPGVCSSPGHAFSCSLKLAELCTAGEGTSCNITAQVEQLTAFSEVHLRKASCSIIRSLCGSLGCCKC